MTPAEALRVHATAEASRMVREAIEGERRRAERRRLPRGRGRRAEDAGRFLSQADIAGMVARERPVCWACGEPTGGPDGHVCGGSLRDMEALSHKGPSAGSGTLDAA